MGIGSIASAGWKYISRGAKIAPDFILGTGSEAFTQVMRNTIKNRAASGQSYWQAVGSGIKNGAKAAEKHNELLRVRDGGFWQSTWKSLTTAHEEIFQGWREGGKLANKAGKKGFSKFLSQFKGALSGVGKRMPLIFTLMAILPEIPNIFSAFKDNGLSGGLTETVKTALRVTTGTIAGAITQALIPIPFVGFMVGYMGGDWLMSKFTGKTHSEKKAEAKEAQQKQQAISQGNGMNAFSTGNTYAAPQLNIPQPSITPQQLMTMQQMLYGGGMMNPMAQDFMAMSSGLNRLNYLG